MAKITELTALTGSNLANGDLFVVSDVGSPNVSKSMTATELADGLATQAGFSSRYVPVTDDRIFLSAPMMVNGGGAGLTFLASEGAVITLDASATEYAKGQVWLPNYWATYNLDMWWTNGGAGAGDVHFTVYVGHIADGVALGGSAVFTNAVTAPAANVVEVTRVQTGGTASDDRITVASVLRTGSDAGDTLANDCQFLGFVFTRAS